MTDTVAKKIEVEEIVRKLKCFSADNPNHYQIAITNDDKAVIGFLQPVTHNIVFDNIVIDSLTRWRSKFKKYFLTQFEPTIERTKYWLENIVLPDNSRILFLIFDDTNKLVGNFGICNISKDSIELDNLIRGEKGGDPKLIFYAELSLMKWAYESLGVSDIYLRVFSNNFKTKALHQLVGFEEYLSQQLVKVVDGDEIRYEVNKDCVEYTDNLHLISMRMAKDTFAERYI
jgi:hypothetical protein